LKLLSVKVNELSGSVRYVVTISKNMDEALKLVYLTADGDGGTIGYIPQVWINLIMCKKRSAISTLFEKSMMISTNCHKRMKCHRCKGLARLDNLGIENRRVIHLMMLSIFKRMLDLMKR
jgi:hypothetical protein